MLALAAQKQRSATEAAEIQDTLKHWREILLNEQTNARAAVPVIAADVRLDWYYGGDHTFPHAADMLRTKLELLDWELDTFLPQLVETTDTHR